VRGGSGAPRAPTFLSSTVPPVVTCMTAPLLVFPCLGLWASRTRFACARSCSPSAHGPPFPPQVQPATAGRCESDGNVSATGCGRRQQFSARPGKETPCGAGPERQVGRTTPHPPPLIGGADTEKPLARCCARRRCSLVATRNSRNGGMDRNSIRSCKPSSTNGHTALPPPRVRPSRPALDDLSHTGQETSTTEAQRRGGDRFRKVRIHRAAPYSLRPSRRTRRARGQQRPDNPTSGTRGRYERAQGHRGARRGQDKSPSPDSGAHSSRLDGDATCRSSRPANSVALLREQDNSENNLVVGKTGQLD